MMMMMMVMMSACLTAVKHLCPCQRCYFVAVAVFDWLRLSSVQSMTVLRVCYFIHWPVVIMMMMMMMMTVMLLIFHWCLSYVPAMSACPSVAVLSVYLTRLLVKLTFHTVNSEYFCGANKRTLRCCKSVDSQAEVFSVMRVLSIPTLYCVLVMFPVLIASFNCTFSVIFFPFLLVFNI